jgi:glycosyltransferase involved in cell wall biosynthesis
VPVVATNVGGMAAHLGDYATLTPRRDAGAMADALVTIAARADAAREQARRGREYVCREWSRDQAFSELRRSLVGASIGLEAHARERAAA